MTTHDYPITGLPTEIGLYESQQFPLDSVGNDYNPYLLLPDGEGGVKFYEGKPFEGHYHEEITGEDIEDHGPYRKVRDLLASEVSA